MDLHQGIVRGALATPQQPQYHRCLFPVSGPLAMFSGSFVALVTPMKDDGALDFGCLERLVDWHMEQGTDGLVIAGTTGEASTLTKAEHVEVIRVAAHRAAGRIPVIAGTGSNSTAQTIDLSRTVGGLPVDGYLVVTPYYNKPTQTGMYEHFKAVAEAVNIPVCVYNIPGRTGKNIEVETIVRLADLPGITMVKEATGSLDQCSSVLASTNLTVLSGDDSLTLPMMSVGAEGVISVVGNVIPEDVIAMVRAASEGDYTTARSWHHKLFPLCRDMLGLATNPIPIKTAMQMLGRDTGELRLPMTPLEDAQVRLLAATMNAYGLAQTVQIG